VADERALELARAREQAAAENWQGKARWRVVAAETLDAWAPPSPTGFLIQDTLSALLHPRRATAALAAAFQRAGGEIVLGDAPQAEGPELWATGYEGLEALTRGLAPPTGRQIGNGVKGQALLLDLPKQGHAQLFVDGLHVVPHVDGTTAIGSTSEREFDRPDSTDAQLDAILERARAALPILAEAPVLARWAGVRPRARSRAPMLGPHPKRPEVFIANGGFKIGFGMAPLVGEVMADLILEQRDRIPESFRVAASL
jgi:glycine oxidase